MEPGPLPVSLGRDYESTAENYNPQKTSSLGQGKPLCSRRTTRLNTLTPKMSDLRELASVVVTPELLFPYRIGEE